MLFTGLGRSVLGETARGLKYHPRPQAEGGTQTEGTVSGKFYVSLQPMYVEVGRVRVDEVRIDCKP